MNKAKALECVSVVNQKYTSRPLDNPMSKISVPKIIKNVNMQVYNFLMRLNETCNVLRHESCKCVCKLSSSVCNN